MVFAQRKTWSCMFDSYKQGSSGKRNYNSSKGMLLSHEGIRFSTQPFAVLRKNLIYFNLWTVFSFLQMFCILIKENAKRRKLIVATETTAKLIEKLDSL